MHQTIGNLSKEFRNMPKVSVIVPVYKTMATLPRTLDSLLRQTLTDFEVIIVDDGTPDKAGIIADEYAARDPRFKVFHQENRGLAEARKSGQRLATGDYHMHLDSDDTLTDDALEVMYNFSIQQETDLLFPGFNRVMPDRTTPIAPYHSDIIFNSRQAIERMLDQSFEYYGGMCFSHRRLWQDLDAMFPPADVRLPSEDIITNFRLALLASRIGAIPHPVYNYYYNPNSLTALGTFYTQDLIHAFFDELEQTLATAGLSDDLTLALDEMKLHYVGFYVKDVDTSDPWVAHLRAIPKSKLRLKYKVLQSLLWNNTLRRTLIAANRYFKRILKK